MLEIRDIQYFADGRSVVDTMGSRYCTSFPHRTVLSRVVGPYLRYLKGIGPGLCDGSYGVYLVGISHRGTWYLSSEKKWDFVHLYGKKRGLWTLGAGSGYSPRPSEYVPIVSILELCVDGSVCWSEERRTATTRRSWSSWTTIFRPETCCKVGTVSLCCLWVCSQENYI